MNRFAKQEYRFFSEKHQDFNEVFDFLALLHTLNNHHCEMEADSLKKLSVYGPLKLSSPSLVDKNVFYNNVLIGQVERQLQDLFAMTSKSLPDWLWTILHEYPWLLPFELRKTFFDIIYLDHNRSCQSLLEINEKDGAAMARQPSTPANPYSSSSHSSCSELLS